MFVAKTQVKQVELKELLNTYKVICEKYELNDAKINAELIKVHDSLIKTKTHIINLISIMQETVNNTIINHVITTVVEFSKDTSVIYKNLYFAKGNISTICDKLRIKKLGKDRYFGKDYVAPVELNLVKGSDNNIDDNTDSSVDDAAVDNMG